ncbi:hypothetical protein OAV21_05095 [bacterium]|jgi:hypothetical protein|nr:hypothetical protein [Verrucomicrobiales bacterium]MDA7644503.1 hypothetical protein [Verrucomicrobiales bacterium]MDB2347909.1 hypothetical protein [Verrucomicrobiales bacterium]MDB4627232.1 hypothetical protein [bacterium]MDC3255745.1 hypothetical protein [bacterium]
MHDKRAGGIENDVQVLELIPKTLFVSEFMKRSKGGAWIAINKDGL